MLKITIMYEKYWGKFAIVAFFYTPEKTNSTQMNFICLQRRMLLSYIQCWINILQKQGEATGNFENIALLSKGLAS